MPKINQYPNPKHPGQWDEVGATVRIEVGWPPHGGPVHIATTALQPGADRNNEYMDDPNGGPAVPAWDGPSVTLDRDEINQLIRHLREARDKAFGRDE